MSPLSAAVSSSPCVGTVEEDTRTPGPWPLYKHADINSAPCCGHSFCVGIKQIDLDRPRLIDAFAVSQRTIASII